MSNAKRDIVTIDPDIPLPYDITKREPVFPKLPTLDEIRQKIWPTTPEEAAIKTIERFLSQGLFSKLVQRFRPLAPEKVQAAFITLAGAQTPETRDKFLIAMEEHPLVISSDEKVSLYSAVNKLHEAKILSSTMSSLLELGTPYSLNAYDHAIANGAGELLSSDDFIDQILELAESAAPEARVILWRVFTQGSQDGYKTAVEMLSPADLVNTLQALVTLDTQNGWWAIELALESSALTKLVDGNNLGSIANAIISSSSLEAPKSRRIVKNFLEDQATIKREQRSDSLTNPTPVTNRPLVPSLPDASLSVGHDNGRLILDY
ncbi:MAG TPA: hypothetical protein PKB15_08540 [Acidimicrobiia bacterium]|nr:hypothetical protein [Acidimicrobiia bacterium]